MSRVDEMEYEPNGKVKSINLTRRIERQGREWHWQESRCYQQFAANDGPPTATQPSPYEMRSDGPTCIILCGSFGPLVEGLRLGEFPAVRK